MPNDSEEMIRASQELPDVLGMITGGLRVSVGVVQCAFATYPRATALGQPFEGLLLLQSTCDKSLPVTVTVKLPKKDASGARLNLWTPKEVIQLTLQPAETGLLHIPIVSRPTTQPCTENQIQVKIEARLPRGARIVRASNGGRPASILNMSVFRMSILREVGFRIMQPEEGTLADFFDIVPGTITAAPPATSPRYETLWAIRDLAADQVRYVQLEAQARQFAATISRNLVMDPLQKLLETRFSAVGMPLHPAEVLLMAKTITYVLEDGLELEPGFSLYTSRWFQQLVGIIEDEATMQDMDKLMARLFPNALYDAVLLGLKLTQNASGDDLGTEADHINYANEVVSAVEGSIPIDLGHVYLPLVLCGILLNYRLKVMHENPWVSLAEISQAWSGRLRLSDTNFEWITNVFNDFIRRAEKQLDEVRISRPRP